MKSTTIVLALALAAAAAFALPSGDTGSLGLSADADAEVKVPGMIEPFDYLKWLHNSDHEGENNKKNHHHTATSHSKYTTASHSKSTTTSHSKSTTTTSHSKSTAASHSKSSTTAHSKSTVTSHSKSTATSHSRPTATSRSISVHAPVAHPTATHAAIDDAETRVSSNDVAFTWCRTWANSSTCSTASLRHGQCYDIVSLARHSNDNVSEISVGNGRCVIYDNYDCRGDHSGVFVGQQIHPDLLCRDAEWSKRVSAVKCCGGGPKAPWCGPKAPQCHGHPKGRSHR